MEEMDFEHAVDAYYEPMYRFGLSLTHKEDEASELTQEAFYRYAEKGGELRDKSKTKSWLFTTLYRIFLGWKRRETRLQHFEISSVEHELPAVAPAAFERLDAQRVVDALFKIEERYRSPLSLYYLESHSYREIAEILGVPTGTVMSRLSRGKAMLRLILTREEESDARRIIPLNPGENQGEELR